MLFKLEARTEQGDTLSLPFDDVSGGYSVQSIDGLDPVPANMVSSSYANLDGEQYQSSRREKRNIVLKLGYEPDPETETVRDLRNNLYGFFMPKRVVNLRFYLESDLFVDIQGRVETFDSPLFTADPMATISILCFDPDFFSPTPISISSETVSDETMENLFYDGSVDTGVVMTFDIDRSIDGFTIYHQPMGEQVKSMIFAASLLAGDVVQISTVPGNKFATLTRDGVLGSILYGISPYSDWMRLQPGGNAYRVQLAGAAVPYTIEYTDKYGGL